MLVDLPPEIFSQIVCHIQGARTLRNLSLTCQALHNLVEAEGWKTFVLSQFPSFQAPPTSWKDAAHALTTLSRNWDRRAFIARDFEPFHTRIHTVPQGSTEVLKGQWKRPQGQTMGYQPVIDSYETWTSNDWGSRKELVAWGAGAKLMMKITSRGKHTKEEWQEASDDVREYEYDRWGNHVEWVSYHNAREHVEGRDDITTVNIIRQHQRSTNEARTGEELVVGRANGELSLLNLAKGITNPDVRQFETGGSLVRSADVSLSGSPLLAACLGDSRAVLYSVQGSETRAAPISAVNCVPNTESRCRTWTTRFLSTHKLAVGKGASHDIVSIYDVQPTGLSDSPVRCFGRGRSDEKNPTSAYSITGIPESTVSNETTGNVFFSGGYDGAIRLHDMRSPSDCESVLQDPTDSSAIFSLLMIGRERIVAGGAINALLKIFDVRMLGGRVYEYLDAQSDFQDQNQRKSLLSHANGNPTKTSSATPQKAWNIFTSPQEQHQKRPQFHSQPGPIYSLSRPSPSSTSLYIGRENSVTHFTFTSVLDPFPDPVFTHSLRYFDHSHDRNHDNQHHQQHHHHQSPRSIDIQGTWDPPPLAPSNNKSYAGNRVLKLSMYEQTASGNIPLRVQRDVARTAATAQASLKGYDERWVPIGG